MEHPIRAGSTRIRSDRGFTLIELLVVVLIVGLLAAIAVPVYRMQKRKAYLAELRSDAHSVVVAFESYRTDHGRYPDLLKDWNVNPEWRVVNTTAADDMIVTGLAPVLSPHTQIHAFDLTGSYLPGTPPGAAFCIEIRHTQVPGQKYYRSDLGGWIPGSCLTAGPVV